MARSALKTAPALRDRLLARQLLPVLCCLAIQAMWLLVIRGLEGVISTESDRSPQLWPALKL